MSKIIKVKGRQVFDSRGNPTVEAEVFTKNNSAKAICPSGASTGTFEAFEKRDSNNKKYLGKSVLNAVNLINTKISKNLKGQNIHSQEKIDAIIVYASKFLTGFLVFYFFLVSLLGLFVGRYGQARYMDSMPSFREEVLNISLGRVDVIFFFCCLLGVMFKFAIFLDSIMIPCLPFLIDALSLLHRLGRNNNSVRYSLYFMYILMWFFWYLVLPIVAFVGMTDSWFNFRKRLSNS